MTGQVFDDEAPIRRVAREGLLIAGGGRATVLQVAHPQIALGTLEHSSFIEQPVDRLRITLAYLYGVIFGSPEESRKVSRAVAGIHRKVIGPGYSAADPDLQVWVAATLFDTAMVLYEPVFGPLPALEAETCYQQYSVLATAIGCPESAWPRSRAAFTDYWQHMITTIRIGDDARKVAAALLNPVNLPPSLRLVMPLNRFITIGLLPEPIRAGFGYSWTPRQEGRLRRGLRVVSTVYPRLPLTVRELPKARYLGQFSRTSDEGRRPAADSS